MPIGRQTNVRGRAEAGCAGRARHDGAMPRSPRLAAFAVVAPGLENVLQRELLALGLRPTARPGGAALRLSTRELYLANLAARTATRVLVRVGTPGVRTTTFAELQAAIGTIDFGPWLHTDTPVDVRV